MELGKKDVSNIVNLPRMIQAKFCYFTARGKFHLRADGMIREHWSQIPNSPKVRRSQIMQDNKGVMPGVQGRASEYFIHITSKGSQVLVLPEV
jgi:hypothetical protein